MKSLLFAVMATVTLAVPCEAGTWVGGGGEFNMDVQNPWFVQNTKKIKACVLIDREHFHLPSHANADPNRYLQQVIHVAFKYWQDELAVGTRWLRNEDNPTVGTQDLEFGPCADDTDLPFQFGTLSKTQQEAFRNQGQDPRKFVSLAVRTDYDRINLRGKGFIYVTADSGPLQPTHVKMMPQPWAKGEALLIKVLAHELGHVFGLQHTTSWGIPSTRDLMASGFPATMVKDADDEAQTPIPLFFSVNHTKAFQFSYDAESPYSAAVASFLNLTAVPQCLAFERTDSKIEIFAQYASCGDNDKTLLGSVNLDASKMSLSDLSPAVSIWLPPEQTIFERQDPSEPRQTLALRMSFVQGGEYHDARSNMKRRMLVTIGPSPHNPIFGMTEEGDLIDLLFHTPGGGSVGPVMRFAQ